MRSVSAAAAAAAVAWVFGGPAAAQFEEDSSEPIEITADTLEWMENDRIAIARGDADAVQGRYRLYADELTAYLSEPGSDPDAAGESDRAGEIRRIDADGNVRFVTPEEVITGAAGTYDVERRLVHLEGGVVMTQGENVVRGDRLDMNLDTGVSTVSAVESSDSGGRVSALFVPEDDGEAGDGEAGDEADGGAEAAPPGGADAAE